MSTMLEGTVQDDFRAGSNWDTAPHLIDPDGAYSFVNMVLDDDGSAYRRGGTTGFSSEDVTVPGPGRFLFDGILNVGRRTLVASSSDTFVLGDDDETLVEVDGDAGFPYARQTAVMKGLLFVGGGVVYGGARSSTVHSASGVVSVTFGSRTVTRSSGSWSGEVVPGHLMKIGSGRVYEVESVASGTSLTLRDPYQGSTASGQSATFYPIYRQVAGDPYDGGEFVCVCQNRLVVGSGDRVRFSAIDNPHSFPVNNFHRLPGGAVVSGLATIGGTCLVFTTDGVWTIDGLAFEIVDSQGNVQHRLERLSDSIILAGAAGIAGYENRLVVPAADGIWLVDGVSTPERISRGVERPYKAWLRSGFRFGRAVVFRGHYLLPIVSLLGSVRDMFVCRLDRPVKTRLGMSFPWVRFSGDGGETAAFAVRHGAEQLSPKLLGVQGRDDARIVECSDFFNPDTPNAVDADGSAPVPQLITRDFESGNRTVNSVRSIGLRYELRGANGLGKVEVSAGGPNFDVSGSSSPLRKWGDVEGEWADEDGVWGVGFGPADPDVVVEPPEGAVFTEIGSLGESDGVERVKLRVNRRVRYSRYRVTLNGDVESFRIRAIELFTRPSLAVRR